jgi:hypothetical protein
MIMLISSINAVCYNLTHTLMIKKLSAVATTVLGEVKIISLLVLSAFLLGMWAGGWMGVAGGQHAGRMPAVCGAHWRGCEPHAVLGSLCC